MKNYGLSNDKRKTVLLVLFVISLVLGYFLYPRFNDLIAYISSESPSAKEFIERWDYVGFLPTQVTVFVIFNLLSWLFNCLLWKWKPFQKLLNVPNLNGKWEGAYKSIREENGHSIETTGTMVLSITQNWNKMKCTSSFPTSKSESYSDVIYLDVDSPQGVVLKFTYTNKSQDLASNLVEFSGYNELTLSDNDTLTGIYYTKRIPSTRGNLLLIRRSSKDEIHEVAN